MFAFLLIVLNLHPISFVCNNFSEKVYMIVQLFDNQNKHNTQFKSTKIQIKTQSFTRSLVCWLSWFGLLNFNHNSLEQTWRVHTLRLTVLIYMGVILFIIILNVHQVIVHFLVKICLFPGSYCKIFKEISNGCFYAGQL